MSAKVTVTVKLPRITTVMDEATVKTLALFGEDILDLIDQEVWLGFKYGEHYPEEQRGTSKRAWQVDNLEPGESGFLRGIRIFNDAQVQTRVGTKKNGQPYSNSSAGSYYAAFVQKSGEAQPLFRTVVSRIKEEIVPDFETELLINIRNMAADKAETKELRADKAEVQTYDFDL